MLLAFFLASRSLTTFLGLVFCRPAPFFGTPAPFAINRSLFSGRTLSVAASVSQVGESVKSGFIIGVSLAVFLFRRELGSSSLLFVPSLTAGTPSSFAILELLRF